MNSRLLALTLSLGLLSLPLATPVSAAGTDTPGTTDAVVLVSQADLPALLASGYVNDYSIVSAEDVGLDVDSVLGPAPFGDDSVLTPTELGIDNPQWGFFPGPFFRGFTTVGVVVPVFTFRTFAVRPFFPHFRFFPFFGGFGSPFGFTRIVIIR